MAGSSIDDATALDRPPIGADAPATPDDSPAVTSTAGPRVGDATTDAFAGFASPRCRRGPGRHRRRCLCVPGVCRSLLGRVGIAAADAYHDCEHDRHCSQRSTPVPDDADSRRPCIRDPSSQHSLAAKRRHRARLHLTSLAIYASLRPPRLPSLNGARGVVSNQNPLVKVLKGDRIQQPGTGVIGRNLFAIRGPRHMTSPRRSKTPTDTKQWRAFRPSVSTTQTPLATNAIFEPSGDHAASDTGAPAPIDDNVTIGLRACPSARTAISPYSAPSPEAVRIHSPSGDQVGGTFERPIMVAID